MDPTQGKGSEKKGHQFLSRKNEQTLNRKNTNLKTPIRIWNPTNPHPGNWETAPSEILYKHCRFVQFPAVCSQEQRAVIPRFIPPYPGPPINFFHEVCCLVWLSPWKKTRRKEAMKRRDEREEVGLRLLSSSAQLGRPFPRSCNTPAEEASSQSCAVCELPCLRCPSTGTPSPLRAVWPS